MIFLRIKIRIEECEQEAVNGEWLRELFSCVTLLPKLQLSDIKQRNLHSIYVY